MNDNDRYCANQKDKSDEYEELCTRCGICCGSEDGDPCQNLVFDLEKNAFFCKDYENRLGPQTTVSGQSFNCVPIVENFKMGSFHAKCAYRRYYK
jgi:uncharacterized cysteine cluster protein YcgN (CxxCxxCC family)